MMCRLLEVSRSGYYASLSRVRPTPREKANAEMVDKMHAVCVLCGAPAHYSQRIAGGSEQVQVGDVEAYEARCRRCFTPFAGSGGGSGR